MSDGKLDTVVFVSTASFYRWVGAGWGACSVACYPYGLQNATVGTRTQAVR